MTMLNYLSSAWPKRLYLTLQHLMLVSIAVGLAILVGVPTGVMMILHRGLVSPLLGLATVILTLPSIALFGLMIPLFSRFGQGSGPLPVITAVFLYLLLPIMWNTFLALDGIEEGVKEVGIGIGMTFWQSLRLVDFPFAVPVILGDARSAVVMNIVA